jgi:hypothetical protein
MMFDAKKILEDTPERVSGPLPAGWYEATIKQFVMKTSKSSEEYLNVEMQTDQGRIWYNLNIKHSKDQVRKIAAEQLARLCMAAGFNSIKNPENPDELVGAKVKVLVDVDGSFNRVKTVEQVEKNQAPEAKVYSTKDQTEEPADFDDDIPF